MRERLKDLRDRVQQSVREKVRSALEAAEQSPFASVLKDNLSAAQQASRVSGAAPSESSLRAPNTQRDDLVAEADEPPVVARLIVEIRSDGTRTVARGALKDELSGEQVSLVARGDTPLELALQLSRALITAPLTAGQLAKAMLQQRAAAQKAAPPAAAASRDNDGTVNNSSVNNSTEEKKQGS